MVNKNGMGRAVVMIGLLLGASSLVGCGPALDGEVEAGRLEQALGACQGASCDGLRPADTQCKLDMQDTGVGTIIVDASGRVIGGIGLFRSPSCQTVWAVSSFYVSGGPRSFSLCAVRRRASLNEPSCFDFYGSFGNDSPMKFASSGKTVFGKVTVGGRTTRTADLVVP